MTCFHQVSFSRQRAPASIEHSYPKGRGRKKIKGQGVTLSSFAPAHTYGFQHAIIFLYLTFIFPCWLADLQISSSSIRHKSNTLHKLLNRLPQLCMVKTNSLINTCLHTHTHKTSGSASDLILTDRQINKAEVDSLKRRIEFKIPSKSDQEKKKIKMSNIRN